MRKGTLKAIVDALLFVCLVNSTLIGILLAFFIGKGPNPRLPKVLWGVSRHEWGDVHLWFSLGMVGLAVVHLALQTSWMRAMSKQLARLHWGLALAILLALALSGLYGTTQIARGRAAEAHAGDRKQYFQEQGAPRKRWRGGRGKAGVPTQ